MLNDKKPFIWYGGDYNPDQWDEKTIDQDMIYFKKAGINLVTLPVFSWAKLEPEEGKYCFEWLDRILGKLWDNQIHVILATPTTAQPAWMSKKYPEILPVDIAGRKRTHGMRVFFCVNSEKYRERAAAIAEEMAKRYRDYPGLAAWHVSNEYGTYCYCDHCQEKFREWLKKRYGTVECLNEKWSAAFWGRTVYAFEEVMLPTELNDDYRFHPAVQLDYMRFVTDSTLECYLNEAEILKRYTPELPVYSNISGYIKKLNQFKLVEQMDCAGWDNYPAPGEDPALAAMKHDLMRALKRGSPYIIAEQSPAQQNWQPYNKLKRPGEVRTIAYQGLGRGADACLFFQMRQSTGGQEKFHGAVISHEGTDDTRTFREIETLGAELKKLGNSFLGGRSLAEAGMIFDWESWWVLELSSGPTKDMDYLKQFQHYYKALYDQNIQTDLLRPDSDLSNYKLIIAPLLYIVMPETARRLDEFVKAGGTLIATYRTGVADENDRCIFGAAPGCLRETLGLWVEETDALLPEERNHIKVISSINDRTSDKVILSETGFLCDILRLENARPLACYTDDFYKETPCITVNERGKGRAYYLASQLSQEFLAKWMGEICDKLSIKPVFQTEGKVELTSRETVTGTVTFILNHGREAGAVLLGNDCYVNLLTEETMSRSQMIKAGEVLVVRKKQNT